MSSQPQSPLSTPLLRTLSQEIYPLRKRVRIFIHMSIGFLTSIFLAIQSIVWISNYSPSPQPPPPKWVGIYSYIYQYLAFFVCLLYACSAMVWDLEVYNTALHLQRELGVSVTKRINPRFPPDDIYKDEGEEVLTPRQRQRKRFCGIFTRVVVCSWVATWWMASCMMAGLVEFYGVSWIAVRGKRGRYIRLAWAGWLIVAATLMVHYLLMSGSMTEDLRRIETVKKQMGKGRAMRVGNVRTMEIIAEGGTAEEEKEGEDEGEEEDTKGSIWVENREVRKCNVYV